MFVNQSDTVAMLLQHVFTVSKLAHTVGIFLLKTKFNMLI